MAKRGLAGSALGSVVGLLLGQVAFAADLPFKAPAYKAPAVAAYDWTGVYLGANVGYGVARDHSSETLTFPNGTQFSGEPFTLAPAGMLAGGQIGANWQRDRLVLGVEGDWQWSAQKDGVCIQTCSIGTGALNQALTVDQQIKWLATLRARVGYADGGFLWYVTGGAAWARVDDTVVAGAGARPAIVVGFDRELGGWTAGAGVETAIAGHWTGKLEYLYVDLAATSDVFTSFFNNTQAVQTNVRDHIVRLGLNYRFGGSDGPYASAAAADTARNVVRDWRGFYIGANAGYGLGRDKGNEVLPILPVFPAFSAQSFTLAPAGALAGGQAGYNWQLGNWVAGLEGDWDWTDQHDVISITMGTPPSNLNQIGLTLDQRLRWLATARGRIGYDRGGWLWYLTGGAAWGNVQENDALTVAPPTVVAASFSHTRTGWTVGGGVEKTIVGNWTGRLEYLYVDLGTVSDAFATTNGAVETIQQRVTDSIIRFGLNYKFGG